ncbi:hypothetical protein E4U39_001159 [Claviceps sp. Clav50 group G5]|nr:hypothetical protein E4U39_001159 [Claviceps sp. Clav50 group G5]
MTFPGVRAKASDVGVGASEIYNLQVTRGNEQRFKILDVGLDSGHGAVGARAAPADRHKVYIEFEPTLVSMMVDSDLIFDPLCYLDSED